MNKKDKHKQFDKDSFGGFKSGFVGIIGAPNVGKSTFLNYVLNRKVSITSKKPQTTRNRILGILTGISYQIAFVDTPGIHKSSGILNKRIVDKTFAAIMDVDLILFIVDASNHNLASELAFINKIKSSKKPIILAINKIDRIKKTEVLKIIKMWSENEQFENIFPICALNGYQVKPLVNSIRDSLVEGPRMFPDDTFTNVSKEFILSEVIREKVFRLTGQEVPYSVFVSIDIFQKEIRIIRIYATIHVERSSQKGIIIGKNGKKLSQIGEESRLEIQKLLKNKVFIKLFVRIQKNWSKDTKTLERFGY